MQNLRQSSCVIWLGLLALALQFVLSFGHHHGNGAVQFDGGALTAVPAELAKCLQTTAESRLPSDSDDDEDHCAICWTIAIAGTASLPDLAIVASPALAGIPLEPAKYVALEFSAPTASFQARAPPAGPIA